MSTTIKQPMDLFQLTGRDLGISNSLSIAALAGETLARRPARKASDG